MIKKFLLTLLELNAKLIIQETGEKAQVSGVWRSGDEFICLSKGERFIPSENNLWTLVVSV